MKSIREKIIFSFVALVTLASVAIFAATFVKAAIYDSGTTGIGQGLQTARTAGYLPGASNTNSDAAPAEISAGVVSPEYPARLIIPALGIDASVQKLGINAKGNIGVPSNFTDVGWYSYGTIPGKAGMAIIDGHVDNGLGLNGVFKYLSNIRNGDEVDVVTYGGATLRFVVTNIQLYYYQDVPSGAIFGSNNAPNSSFLNLITCDGTWVQGGDTYDERLVVTATLVTQP